MADPLTLDHTLEQAPQLVENMGDPVFIRSFLSRIEAGFPSPCTEHEEAHLDLNQYLIRNKTATFIFQVKGQSMSGAGIIDGDKVLVDRSIDPIHNDIVIAVVNDQYTIKRLFKLKGRVELHAENTQFAPITFAEGSELCIWGVVIGLVRKIGRLR